MPPVALTTTLPAPPLHKAAVGVADTFNGVGSATLALAVALHPLSSVTV